MAVWRGGSIAKRRRRRADPTDDWEQLELLCAWEEQREYERIRPLVPFGEPIPERAVQTGTSERTLYRRIAGFEEDGMRSLFGSDPAKRRVRPRSGGGKRPPNSGRTACGPPWSWWAYI